MTELLSDLGAQIAALPPSQQGAVKRALRVLGQALIEEPPRILSAFVGAEAGGEVDATAVRNRARLELLSEQLRAETLPTRELAARSGLSRQRLQQLRAGHRLLGFQPPLRREFRHPRWQFDAEWHVLAIVPKLIAAAESARLTPLGLHLTLTNPAAGVDGRPLVDLLADHPDDVLESIAGSGDIGS